jgi:hypothetical protein
MPNNAHCRVDTIILTSEDRRFVDARVNYTDRSGHLSCESPRPIDDWGSARSQQLLAENSCTSCMAVCVCVGTLVHRGWRFVVNPLDVMQASGAVSGMRKHDMDDVFMSFYR